MKHRIFIAINLPEDIKKELVSCQEKWQDLPVRRTKKDNLHITLVFIGQVEDSQILEIGKTAKDVIINHHGFSINLHNICYGPPGIMPPKMVWAMGEKNKELSEIKKDLETALLNSENSGFNNPENRDFSPHITLGRIKQWEWRRVEPEERPEINKDIFLDFEVNSIDIMESRLRRGGSEYIILESISLGG